MIRSCPQSSRNRHRKPTTASREVRSGLSLPYRDGYPGGSIDRRPGHPRPSTRSPVIGSCPFRVECDSQGGLSRQLLPLPSRSDRTRPDHLGCPAEFFLANEPSPSSLWTGIRAARSSIASWSAIFGRGLGDVLSFGRTVVRSAYRAWCGVGWGAGICPARHVVKNAEWGERPEVVAACTIQRGSRGFRGGRSTEAWAAAVPSIDGRGARRNSGQGRGSDVASGTDCPCKCT